LFVSYLRFPAGLFAEYFLPQPECVGFGAPALGFREEAALCGFRKEVAGLGGGAAL
jgi:hypothetical protein